jgi:hypothetical protein
MGTTAFALAGLGGFNAHGAGFLTAASECHVVPDLITATSGQIVVVSDWLQGKNLEKSLIDPNLAHSPLAQLAIALYGDPGVFRPAYLQALVRWWMPPGSKDTPVEVLLDRLVPAQVYVPSRNSQDFSTIADVLNNHATVGGKSIGIVFNSYDLETGTSILFGNKRARELWPKTKNVPPATRSGGPRTDGATKEQEVQPITPEAVRSALWLSLYGFENLPQPHLIDGAYGRSCIVSELHKFDRVFVARPLADGWLGRPPRNWFEVQDWQTEMWFSVGYRAEVDALQKINALIAQGSLGAPYKLVELVEVAPRTPAGFFHYFIEREAVFRRAYDGAVAAFREASIATPTPAHTDGSQQTKDKGRAA